MTDLEKIISTFMNDIKIALPCEITKLSGMYAEVKPVIFDNVDFPVIPDVPICFFGSSSSNLKFKSSVGDIVTVFFTQMDLGNFLARGKTGQVLSKEKFNLTSAFALPFNIHSKTDSQQLPTLDFEFVGNVKIGGNLEVTGDIKSDGDIEADNIQASGDIEASGDIKTLLVNLGTHVHPTAAPGPPSPPTPGT